MEELLYSSEHLWFHKRSDTIVRFGFTTNLVIPGHPEFLRLPSPGAVVDAGGELGCLETDKCTIDIRLPFPARIVDANAALCDAPARLLDCDLPDRWLCDVELPPGVALTDLMTERQYRAFCRP